MMRMIMGGTGQEPGWFLKIRGGLGELGECGAGGLLLCSFTFFCAHRGRLAVWGRAVVGEKV